MTTGSIAQGLWLLCLPHSHKIKHKKLSTELNIYLFSLSQKCIYLRLVTKWIYSHKDCICFSFLINLYFLTKSDQQFSKYPTVGVIMECTKCKEIIIKILLEV